MRVGTSGTAGSTNVGDIHDGGMGTEQVEVIADELQAMERGLQQLGDGELLVILADKVRATLERLERHGDVAA